jgi:CubicO group peptidase (beta-lactamase class C family)
VVLIGNQGAIIYRRAFGNRAVKPKNLPMKTDTIFDIASLTKVVATTTAVMQLVEKGKLRIEDRVADHWPEFAENGRGEITVRQLLTHYSGLRPDLDMNPNWAGCDKALQMILSEKPTGPPDTRFIYSDINFIILGELVRRISGYSLDTYCTNNIQTSRHERHRI